MPRSRRLKIPIVKKTTIGIFEKYIEIVLFLTVFFGKKIMERFYAKPRVWLYKAVSVFASPGIAAIESACCEILLLPGRRSW